MRHQRGGTVLGLLALLALPACTLKQSDEAAAGAAGAPAQGGSAQGGSAQAGAGGSTQAGAAGQGAGAAGAAGSSAGAGGSAQAGAGGSGADPCQGVPTTGVCEGNKVRLCQVPPPGVDAPPQIVETSCADDEQCATDGPGTPAYCKSKFACKAGEALCDGDTLRTCKPDRSGFASIDCTLDGGKCVQIDKDGKAPHCQSFSNEAGVEHSLRVCLTFERQGMDTTGPTDPRVDIAVLQKVAVYNGDKYIGQGVTGPSDGCADIQLEEAPAADATIYVYALDFDEATGKPLVGVVYPPDKDPGNEKLKSNDYWHWSNKDQNCGSAINVTVQPNGAGVGKHTLVGQNNNAPGSGAAVEDSEPDMLVPISCGSGAMRIFQWVRFGMARLGPNKFGLDTLPGETVNVTTDKPQLPVAIFWKPGLKMPCGNCFAGPQFGGAEVNLPGGVTDSYDSYMLVSGTEEWPGQWAYSVLSHELGHWVTATYSRSPGEGGQHFINEASIAGLAFSEGQATTFGQFNVSAPSQGVYDGLYIAHQAGTTFWVNVGTLAYSGGSIELPDPQGPLDQNINENVVTAMMWHLWFPKGGDGENAKDYFNLGNEKIFQALGSDRVRNANLNRGYPKLDLLDFFDAVQCGNLAPNNEVSSVSQLAGYPWDAAPLCP